jgi:tetratricopeptide (TPR) repeat protein
LPGAIHSLRCGVLGCLALAAFTVFSWNGVAAGAESEFDAANKFYEQGKYAEASAAYHRLLRQGTLSAAIYFNLGNARLRAGHLGEAIHFYREAARLAPRDPDIRANLRFARSQVSSSSRGSAPAPVSASPPAWFPGDWISRLTLDEWSLLFLAGNWSWFGLLMLGKFRPGLREKVRTLGYVVGVAAVVLAVCLTLAYQSQSRRASAVVVVPAANIRYGPLAESEVFYSLRDGTEVRVLARRSDWIQIKFQNRKGWIRQADAW